jgi:cobalt/nickel transport system ATP-binding protein
MAVVLMEAEKIRFAYSAGPWVLDGISFRLHEGERVAVLGANGAGKSTLLHLLMGLHHACEGTIRLSDHPVPRTRAGQRLLQRGVGLVLQDPDDQLFAETVLADVVFGPLNAGLPPDEAEDRGLRALREMNIHALASRRISTLSLGQKKKVALAGILAMDPKVLVLDEPTAGLDHNGGEALIQALLAKSRQGVAIVFATHDTDLALAWADRVLVLESGVLAADGSPRQLLADRQLCQRAGLRLPLLSAVALQLRQQLVLDPDIELPATPEQLAEWLQHSLANRQGVLR